MTGTAISSFFGKFFVLASLLAFTSVSAEAETLMPGSNVEADSLFVSFLVSQPYGTTIARNAAVYDRALGVTCEGNYSVVLQGAQVVRPVVTVPEGPRFVGEGVPLPAGGVWSNRYQIERCDQTIIYNAIAGIADNGGLTVRHLVPGTTGLHPLLINPFKPQIAQLAEIPECTEIVVTNTAQDVPEGYTAEQDSGVYETWSLAGCEQAVRLVMRFGPDAENSSLSPSVENRQVIN
jgi:hypothetical protein